MKICTIAGACVTRIDSIAFSPAGAELHVAHPVYDVVVKGSCTYEVTILAFNDFFGNAAESLIGRHKSLRVKISLGGRRLRWINASPNQRLLIADEVGLGKTIEAGFIYQELNARNRLGRVLVVCPSALRFKWQEFRSPMLQ